MNKLLMLPAAALCVVFAVLVLAYGTSARQAGNPGASSGIDADSAWISLASATADRAAEESSGNDQDSHSKEFFFEHKAPHALIPGGRIEGLIDELLESGDLTEAGAEKLRESLSGNHFFGLQGPLGFDFNSDGNHHFNKFMFAPHGEGSHIFDFSFSGEDDGRRLEIRIEDGEVIVEGEGYSEEELAEIREKVSKQHAEGKHFMLFDGPLHGGIHNWQSDELGNSFLYRKDGAGDMPFGGIFEWKDEDGKRFDSWEEFQKNHPELSWDPEDGVPFQFPEKFFYKDFPDRFMFFDHDPEEMRHQIEEMVREILEEMGVDHSGKTVDTQSA